MVRATALVRSIKTIQGFLPSGAAVGGTAPQCKGPHYRPGFPGCVVAGCNRETHEAVHNWPYVVRVRERFGRQVIIQSRYSDSLWRARCMYADFGRQLYGVSSDTVVWLASGLSKHCVKKNYGLAGPCVGGRKALNLRLSRVRTGVAAMGQELPIGFHEN